MIVDTLRQQGIALVDPLTSGEAVDIWYHLSKCEVKNAHVWNKGTETRRCPRLAALAGWPVWTTRMWDVVKAPHLLEAALEVMPVARDYFGEPPLLYSMNAFWTNPSSQRYEDTHDWHRDGDDRKQLVLFVYGSTITEPEEGAHLYQAGTHLIPDSALGYPYQHPPSYKSILGHAGTAFLADTSGLHMGLRPCRTRLLLWARWGVSDPPESYKWDALAPVPRAEIGDRYPSDLNLQAAIRLVVS